MQPSQSSARFAGCGCPASYNLIHRKLQPDDDAGVYFQRRSIAVVDLRRAGRGPVVGDAATVGQDELNAPAQKRDILRCAYLVIIID
jgi:hypothetical protein